MTTTEKATLSDEFSALAGHRATVAKGCRKFNPGTQLNVKKVGVNRYGKPYAIVVTKKGDEFIDPKWLKIGKPLSASVLAEYETASEEAQSTVILTAEIVKESEKGLRLKVDEFMMARWISKKLAPEGEEDGTYNVPMWWATNEFGKDFAGNLPEAV